MPNQFLFPREQGIGGVTGVGFERPYCDTDATDDIGELAGTTSSGCAVGTCAASASAAYSGTARNTKA
ncbi:MAG: hypothetical protein ACKPKO_34810, partial [Candidatus Fonsibacter sp.]